MKKGLLVGGFTMMLVISGLAFAFWAVARLELSGWSSPFCFLLGITPMWLLYYCMTHPKLVREPGFLKGYFISSGAVYLSGMALWHVSDLPFVSPDAGNWRVYAVIVPASCIVLGLMFRKRFLKIQ